MLHEMDFLPWQALPLLAVALTFVLLGFLLPPAAVVVRKARPVLSTMGIFSWLLYRMFFGGGPSLLDLLVTQLKHVAVMVTGDFPLAPFIQWIWLIFQDILAILLLGSAGRFIYCLCHYSVEDWKALLVQGIFEWSQGNIPVLKVSFDKIKNRTGQDIKNMIGKDPDRVITTRLPLEGLAVDKLLKQMQKQGALENRTWQEGKVSGAVYAAGETHTRLMQSVYSSFTWANPLHYGMWPTVNQCEAEVIAMTANLLHGNDKIVGTTSSGGTESILLAIRAHVEYFGRKRGISHPELVCGPTAHAAVDKACELMGIRKVCVKCDPVRFTLVPLEIEKHITCNTIMMYASAPTFMQGVIDPIEELSEIALKYDIGFHVDCCLGGYVLPFAKKLGHAIPKFDFECPGVTSMSADTHKFAYASKGTSVVLYRHEELRHAQYFCYSKWTGGMYSTPTIAGSRPGALLACAWAALVSIGESGYQERVQAILKASQAVADGISQIPGIRLLGSQAPTMIVCFDSTDLEIYRVGGKMTKKGWELNALQSPPCLHLCVTLNTIPYVDKFISDLRDSVDEVRKEGPDVKRSGSAAMYGMAGGFPAGPVNELLRIFIDQTLTP